MRDECPVVSRALRFRQLHTELQVEYGRWGSEIGRDCDGGSEGTKRQNKAKAVPTQF